MREEDAVMHIRSTTMAVSLDALPPGPASSSAGSRISLAAVATVLTPAERLRVDAAGEGLYRAIHRDTVEDVIRDLKERRAGAVLVSVSRCCDSQATSRVAAVVREFPRVPAVALLTQLESDTARTVLALVRVALRQWWRCLDRACACTSAVGAPQHADESVLSRGTPGA